MLADRGRGGGRPGVDADHRAHPRELALRIGEQVLVAHQQPAVGVVGRVGALDDVGAIPPDRRLPADERQPPVGAERVGAVLRAPRVGLVPLRDEPKIHVRSLSRTREPPPLRVDDAAMATERVYPGTPGGDASRYTDRW